MFVLIEKINIKRAVLHLSKYIPDKVFNYNTYFKNKYETKKISILYRYKKHMGLIVSLRAPKHFKVGRQQYNTYKSLAYLVVNFKNSNNKFYNTKSNEISLIKTVSEKICDDLPYTVLAEHSCIKFKYSITCKFTI